MTEHDRYEPLERLAGTAPAPAPGLASDVVQRGRTVRRRRRGIVTVAAAAVAAAAVVLVPLLGSGDTERSTEPPVATDPTGPEPTNPTTSVPPQLPSARMQVAAAAVRRLLVYAEYDSARSLTVRSALCGSALRFDIHSRQCVPLDPSQRAELELLLPGYAIRWVGRNAIVSAPLGGDGPYVEISRLGQVHADGGPVFVFALRGGRDCSGIDYRVRLVPDGRPFVRPSGQQVVC